MATRINSKFVSFNGNSLVFPAGVGANSNVLTTDGSGNLSWSPKAAQGGGTIRVVNPSHPDADDTNSSTPYLTIQAAIDDCPQYGIVLIMPGDYTEDLTLDSDVALVGHTNQAITGWNSGYVYNSGTISLPSTASGIYFVLENLYLEQNSGAVPLIQTDKQVYLNINNCVVYNNFVDAAAYAIYHTAGASSVIRILNTEVTSTTSSKSIITDVDLSGLTIQDSFVYSNIESRGSVTLINSDISENISCNSSLLANNCQFFNFSGAGEFITGITGSGPFNLNNCRFAGDCDYLVNTSNVAEVWLNAPRFSDSSTGDTGFKSVAGSAILYRTDCSGEVLLNKITGISGTVPATTVLLETPTASNYRINITKVVLRLASATGLTGTMQAGIGVAAGEDDIFESTILDNFTTVNDLWIWSVNGKSKLIPGTSSIKLGIDTAFSGTVTIDAEIHGYVVRI